MALALARLEQKNGDLAQVEVNEVLRLVRNVRAEIATNDTMPSWRVSIKVQGSVKRAGTYFLSNSFLMKAAISFSMLYFSKA